MSSNFNQWIRRVNLVVFSGAKGLDLSDFRIRFSVQNADVETPNTAAIRVYNLSHTTVDQIRGEFQEVTLNAGYEGDGSNYGVIFKGTIKQFRIGRENNKDTYLDILAADGDIGYNQGFVNASVAAGATPNDAISEAVAAMTGEGGYLPDFTDAQHTPNIRGMVMFGMARAQLRYLASSLDASWSIQEGKVVMIPLTGYKPGEAVEINVATGLIGIPEQTDGGIKLQCLLNSKLRIGGLVKLNNQEITQLMQANPNAAPIPYNQWSGFQFNTPLSKDGTYRAYVVEHMGDTRGNDWTTSLICLAVDLSAPVTNSVKKA